MRACVQCGLSIGDAATFCQVCGAPAEPGTTPAVEQAAPAPVAAPASAPVTGPAPAAAAPVTEPAGVEDSAEDAASRRTAEVAGLLRDAAAREATDAAAAAGLYRGALVAGLDASEDPLGSEDLCLDLLCGFDRLSDLLARKGIPAEALDVVDSAASLGLLDGGHEAAREHIDALKDRRESLRHILHGDSAQL